MSVQPEELINITRRVLSLLGVKSYSELQITYAFKEESSWRVSFSYTPSMSFTRKGGSFAVNTQTGEIEGMWLDRTWK